MSDTGGAGGGGGTDQGAGGGAEGGPGSDGGGSGAWWHLWGDLKRWLTGDHPFEVETERAVVGVRG